MSKINILFVITKLELGGAQKQLLSVISGLNKAKYNLYLFTADEGILMPEALRIEDLCVYKSKFLKHPIDLIKDIRAIFEISRFIKANNIEIVHTHSSKAGILGRFAAKISGVKSIVHTVHGWSFNNFQNFLVRFLYICLERMAARFTKKVIVVSQRDKVHGLENRIAPDNTYEFINYGVDKAQFQLEKSSARTELGIEASDLVVGSIACFKPQKSPEDFVMVAERIIKIMPHVKFVLIGDGVLRSKIEQSISRCQLNKNVILTGWREDIANLLGAMDIFILTSLWEGLPIVVLEAFASSLPVVATDTGGIAEVVSDGETGFLVPCHNIVRMADKIKILLLDKDQRICIGQNAKNSLTGRFDTRDMVCAHEKIYDSFVKGGCVCG